MTTSLAPSVESLPAGTHWDEDVCHLVCDCDENTALCGEDMSEGSWVDEELANCPWCWLQEEEAGCPKCGA